MGVNAGEEVHNPWPILSAMGRFQLAFPLPTLHDIQALAIRQKQAAVDLDTQAPGPGQRVGLRAPLFRLA